MKAQHQADFSRIEEAIDYIRANFKDQPDLDEIAGNSHLSPYHFQRLFTAWAGVSPKKFLQYISIDHAKKMLAAQASLADAAYETGLSGTGRLHDLFISIEGMTPGEYKNGGEGLVISYSYADTVFGMVLVAATSKGVCHLAFCEDEQDAFLRLKQRFPRATYRHTNDDHQARALQIFSRDWSNIEAIKLHVKGTGFQLKVWESLLKIPAGQLTSYGQLAGKLNQPNAARAVGSAVGDNPVAFLIPCHRVIQAGGAFGQYHWGSKRKTAMIGWEAALLETNS
ncbi:methylated-DNA--[protein]-cysteine S-methyltransferase [Sediminibacterium ginsengisoli]|uniref:methylated-DNA--[protein]-cysteine S-methyltransferase n=1 Tax=Sediminibacterium ginsengisoli TaxID=413434 RepID=A0A1T4K8P8_9BACT|nr:methylated-DNA--[protein]-cysteine S-methyltransferase [Sediminibacterium ginsengisoli]SJZ38818.1 AraC family transcriptional regulator, regulatory protein of adaptative response / methylated-DNA-[protein]-cysteine methyltransferase [Sediminibacterium ginsengisoli]